MLFLMDGFGWRTFEKFQQAPFLKTVARLGQVEKLTAQFPSTTAAQLTTLHTGMPVGEHGVFEWFYYEPQLDAVIAPLLFSFAGTPQRDTLKQAGAKPRQLLPNNTLYQQLNQQDISSTILQQREYTPSSYGDVVFAGQRQWATSLCPRRWSTWRKHWRNPHPPRPTMCSTTTRWTPSATSTDLSSTQTNAEVEVFLRTMETIFLKALKGNPRRIRFLLTADHGQSETDPKTTIYLNREPRFEGIERFLRTTRQGSPLVPAGSARDFFLYIQPGMLEEARGVPRQAAGGEGRGAQGGGPGERGIFRLAPVSPVFRPRRRPGASCPTGMRQCGGTKRTSTNSAITVTTAD